MTFKHVFLSTAAASSLLLAVAALEPAAFSLATKAQAATNIPVSVSFYDELSPYGDWVSYHDRYVWIPDDVDARWRPYTKGHWAYTRSYGWIWVSDERFGWATYHYGRWGYAHDIGWYWVPGSRWAPAWVAWSYDDDDIAWAPLPPDYYDGANIVKSFGFIPDYYWQAVPVSNFLSADLSGHMFHDSDRVRHVIQNSKLQTVHIVENTVLNNVIKVDDIEKKTKKKVVALEEKAIDNLDAVGKVDSNSVAIFNPEVKEEANAKPAKTRKVEEVAKEREAKGSPDEEQPSGQAVTTTDEPVTEPKKDVTAAEIPQKATASTDEPEMEKTVEAPAIIQAPAAPNPALPPSVTVTFDTVHYDQSGNIVFGGRGPVDSKVLLYVDNNAYGLAFINNNGTWSFADLSPLTVGLHTIRAIEIGSDGAVKSRIEMPFYRDEPAKVATAPLTPATPEALKPAEVATAQEKNAAAPDEQPIEKGAHAPAEVQAVTSENKETETTASIDPPDIEKTVEAPVDEPTAPVEEKKKATASINQPVIEKTVEVPAEAQTIPVDEKKKVTASIDQANIEESIETLAEEPAAPIEIKKKKVTAAPEQQAVKKSVEAPAGKQTAPLTKKKKKAEKAVNTALKGQPKCDPVIADCPSALTPSKLKRQNAKRVIPKSILPDVGAENWRVECSARFGGWTKASETYVSSAGKRVSCAIRPKNARG